MDHRERQEEIGGFLASNAKIVGLYSFQLKSRRKSCPLSSSTQGSQHRLLNIQGDNVAVGSDHTGGIKSKEPHAWTWLERSFLL